MVSESSPNKSWFSFHNVQTLTALPGEFGRKIIETHVLFTRMNSPFMLCGVCLNAWAFAMPPRSSCKPLSGNKHYFPFSCAKTTDNQKQKRERKRSPPSQTSGAIQRREFPVTASESLPSTASLANSRATNVDPRLHTQAHSVLASFQEVKSRMFYWDFKYLRFRLLLRRLPPSIY